MKRPLCTLVFSFFMTMSLSLLLSNVQASVNTPGSVAPEFTNPTLTYQVNHLSVILQFTDNSNEDDHYALYRVDESGTVTHAGDFAPDLPGQVQTFEDSNPGGFYYTYYVDAVLLNGTTLPRVAEVTFMQPLEGAVIYMGYPHWEMCGSEALIEYDMIDTSPNSAAEIFRSTSPDDGFVRIATTTDGYYEDDVAPRKTYYYKVRTTRDGQVSPFSEVKSVTVGNDYHAPLFTATVVENGVKVTLGDRTYHEDYYYVRRLDSEGILDLTGRLTLADSGSVYTIVDTTVVPGGIYTYELHAKALEYCDKYSWPWDLETAAYIDVAIPGNCEGAGAITRDLWTNVPGATVADIPVDAPPSSSSEITMFETPNYAGNNYAARIYGYVCVPQTGFYTFWIASDDQSVLYLSSDETPGNKREIASVSRAVRFREYTRYASQKSPMVYLVQGVKYYIEALHKEANGADHISVRWQLPDGTTEQPIRGNHLITYTPDMPVCTGAGYVEQEVWTGITGTDISSIPVGTEPGYVNTVPGFETPRREGEHYGSRIRGYLCLPETGNYTFLISADDKAELWLSTDADPANKRLIASVNRATNYREYNKYASQQSVSIYLDKSVNYYIEALHKEGTADDHLSVAWQLPDGTMQSPISGSHIIAFTDPGAQVSASAAGERIVIGGTGAEGVSLYPNPVSSERKVSIAGPGFGSDAGPTRVLIVSTSGIVVYDQEVAGTDHAQIDIDLGPRITTGVYAVQVLQGRKRQVLKLVVK